MGLNEKRIAFIWEEIHKKFEKYQPDYVAIEDYAYSPQGQKTQLGELAGVVKHHLFLMRVPPFTLVSPQTLKKFATGAGRCSKEEMVEAAQQHYPKVANHDEADALFLALYALDQLKQGRSSNEGGNH